MPVNNLMISTRFAGSLICKKLILNMLRELQLVEYLMFPDLYSGFFR